MMQNDETVTTDSTTDKDYPQTVMQPHRRNTILFIVVPIILFAVLLVVGISPRISRNEELRRVHKDVMSAVPSITAVVAKPTDSASELLMPGSIQPIQNISIYARASGYLKELLVDIGDVVKKGQTLAILETPELDKQVEQAQADVRNARGALSSAIADRQQFQSQLVSTRANIKQWRTNLDFSTTQYKRYLGLSGEGAVSFEQRDQTLKNVNSDQANLEVAEQTEKTALAQVVSADGKVASAKQALESSKANLKRTEALRGFQKVVAGCDGVITNRLVDAGALITSGNNTNTQLLTMARTDALRIYVDVPQSVFKGVHLGDFAEILIPEMPGRIFTGQVTNIAGSITADSRTTQTELKIPNKDHVLTPGAYANVRFKIMRLKPPLVLPSNTLVTRNDGLYVASVVNNKVHYKKVEIERDFGNKAEISAGLNDNDVCLIDPPDELQEGDRVNAIIVDRDNANPSNHPEQKKG